MKNQQGVQNIIQQGIDQNQKVNEFGLSPVPFHSHNGIDSPYIDSKNLKGTLIQVVILTGTTPIINGAQGNIFTITLTGNTTYSINSTAAPTVFMVEVKQGTGTSYTNTWFSGITWVTSGGTAPVQTTTSNGYTVYGFRCTADNTYLGFLVSTN